MTSAIHAVDVSRRDRISAFWSRQCRSVGVVSVGEPDGADSVLRSGFGSVSPEVTACFVGVARAGPNGKPCRVSVMDSP